jgi:adenylate cyclase
VSRQPETGRHGGSDRDDEFWRQFLEQGGDTWQGIGRRIFKRIPADPRCRMCASPFRGPGAPFMRLIGKRQSDANPNWCTSCFNVMAKHRGGAEVEGAMLFADIRGSTALAERMAPGEYHDLLDRYLTTATAIVFKHDGVVDKFVGDELVAMFFPLLTGERYVARAVEAGTDLLRATGHADRDGPWVSIGVGLHAGRAWFGVIGEESHIEMTVVGDAVNVAARLASAAAPGELLVSADTAAVAGLDPSLARQSLALKGKSVDTEVVSIRVDAQ